MNQRQTALAVISEIVELPPEKLAPEMELVADLGLDSAKALELFVELEDRLEIEFRDEDATKMNTVGDILAFFEGA
jgi:acyl carrier protein